MINFKRGDTFIIRAQASDSGTPIDMTNWDVSAQVRDGAGGLQSQLTLAWENQITGIYLLSEATTTAWAVGTLYMDIEYITPSLQIISTETILINCQQDITRI